MRNIVEEKDGGKLGKYFVTQFIYYYSLQFKSIYIQNIKNFQKKLKYALIFQFFYQLVYIINL